ncbi:alpha/beta hydrolase [Anaerosinus massiliensis]|uniref:alpha/beta hydrolase n=1 Tax=Massilibacillus massiliensis TaxID=1806837 RepID=UPI000AB7025C|nr:alpha/beta hydrolase [Massilibacillus massiliensis]
MKNKFSKVYMVIICLFILLLMAVGCAASPQKAASLDIGSGMFTMPETTGVNKDDLQVFYYRPAGWTPDKPIVIVQHGLQRNAEEYRDGWKTYADQYNLLVVCPQYSEAKYPGVRYYNTGNVSDTDHDKGNLQPKNQWVFPVINHVIAEARIRSGATGNNVAVFGHSAGAQLVHRYVLFGGQTQAKRIISANAGWYSMPDTTVDFPYGIKNMSMNKEELAQAFAKPVTILLGEQDIKRSKVLRKTPEADAQGANRFERGSQFFEEAKAKAAELGVPFHWQLIRVPGVGHDDVGMAAAAAKLIAEGEV